MKVTLVRPNLGAGRPADAMEPLCFAILARLTPPEVELACHDERLEEVPFDEPTDLAALTVETYTARRAYQIAAEYRRRGVPVVMGGYHPTLLPEEALEHADAVVVGDAEGTWPRLLADARAGRLERLYRERGVPELDGVTPDRRLFRGKRYAPLTLVQYGRGCRYACDFCSIRAFYGRSVRHRPVAEVVAEIEALAPRHVFFVDDNLFTDRERARALFRALVPLGIRWSSQVSIDAARDPELVALMAASGCLVLLIGFESLSAASLGQMKKAWNLRHGGYAEVVRRLREAGILVYGSFVFGYDGDTPDAFDATVDFALENRLFLANFNPLTPTPGTPLYARLQREGRLLHERWWLDPGYRYGEATFTPRGMSAGELAAGCWRARRRFYTYGSIARRLPGLARGLRGPRMAGLYLLTNLVSRREIRAKQGLALGDPAAPDPGGATAVPAPPAFLRPAAEETA